MSVQEWSGLILTISSIVALVAGGIKWLTKHYFDEIRAEFKPNGGSSLKDQVNRLEKKTSELNERINEADILRREMNSKLDKMYMILLDHVAKNNKE
jgi:hypothetical protein